MPVYEYRCPSCGLFSDLVKMSVAAADAICPQCQGLAPRVLSVPRLTTLSRSQRQLHERNERSAHEPKRVQRHSCSVHDGACASPKPRANAARRPWMLGH